MTSKEERADDTKGFIALLVLVAYILGSVWFLGFNFSYLFALITIFIVLFGAKLQSNKIENGNVVKSPDGTPEKVLNISNALAIIVWLLALGAVVSKGFPDIYGRLVVIMFVAALSTSMTAKDIILFLGLSLLTAFFFESGVLASMVLIVTALFAYACRQSAVFGAIMMVPLLMVGWLVGSGYGAAITQRVDSIATQFDVTTDLSTDGFGSGLKVALNNTWLLITDPNAWYEKQFVTQGTRDEGLTSSALEIVSIEALPSTVYPEESLDVIFSLENQGKKDATNVRITNLGDTFTDACGEVMGKLCNPACDGYKASTNKQGDCGTPIYVGKIAPLEKYYGSISFRSPHCPGTYKIDTQTAYDYEADATLNMQLIGRDYYEDLLRNDKLVWVNELSVASAGPFKLTMRTDRQQPIPVTMAGNIDTPNNMQKFKIYLGITLEHPGRAVLMPSTNQPVVIYIPKTLEMIDLTDDETSVDNSCSLTYAVQEKEVIAGKPVLKYLSQYRSGDIAVYKTKRDTFRGLAETASKDNYIAYIPTDIANGTKIIMESDSRIFGCRFRILENEKKSIDQVKTLMVRSNLKYHFEYERSVSVNVKQSGPIIAPDCKKDAEVLKASPISPLKETPQAETAVIDALAERIYACYLKYKNSLFVWEPINCEDIKVDIDGCTGAQITAGEVADKLSTTYSLTSANAWVWYRNTSGTSEIKFDVLASPTNELFNDKYVFSGQLQYATGLLGWGKVVQISIQSLPSDDPVCAVPPP